MLGQFTKNYDREDETRLADPRYSVDGVLKQYFENAGIPVLVEFPARPLSPERHPAARRPGRGRRRPAQATGIARDRGWSRIWSNLAAAIPGIRIELKYAGTENFLGAVVEGYKNHPKALLSRPAAEALAKVQQQLEPFGLGILVYDAYRPQRAVDHFVRWAEDLGRPETEKRAISPGRQGAAFRARLHRQKVRPHPRQHARPHPGRPRDRPAARHGQPLRPLRRDLLAGQRGVRAAARANRLLLRSVMVENGFRPLKEEWWHFTLEAEPYPQQYFDVPLE